MSSNESVLVDTFIVPAKRDRYRSLLAKAKRRREFLDVLNHCRDCDPRYATELSSGTDVAAELRRRGAPDRCHVISSSGELDGRDMLIENAVDAIEAAMAGSLVGCIPGRLAYYYGEAGEQRLLLEKTPNQPLQTDADSPRR